MATTQEPQAHGDDAAGPSGPRWADWLAAQLLAGRPPAELVEVMVRRGFARDAAASQVAALSASPVLRAALGTVRPTRKMADLFSLLGTLFVRSGFTLERRRLSPEQFFREHFFTNRPVILTGLTDDWPALRTWSLDYFRTRFGDVEVEITDHRDADEAYERNFSGHRRRVSLARYVTMVENGEGNDHYLVARNHVLELPGLGPLYEDFRCPEGFLDPQTPERPYVRLWLGPRGTLTPLHCDDRNVLFAQVVGRKQVKLVPPYFLPHLYNDDRCFSPVVLEAPDLERFPAMRSVPVLEAVLEPGECLFIPLGWWHWVRSLDVAASLTFTNFLHDEPPLIWHSVTL
jgi:hypothetical protein